MMAVSGNTGIAGSGSGEELRTVCISFQVLLEIPTPGGGAMCGHVGMGGEDDLLPRGSKGANLKEIF